MQYPIETANQIIRQNESRALHRITRKLKELDPNNNLAGWHFYMAQKIINAAYNHELIKSGSESNYLWFTYKNSRPVFVSNFVFRIEDSAVSVSFPVFGEEIVYLFTIEVSIKR